MTDAEKIRRDELVTRYHQLLTPAQATVAFPPLESAGQDRAVTEEQLRDGDISELPIRLGIAARRAQDSGYLYPIALDLVVGTGLSGDDALKEEVTRYSLDGLYDNRVMMGWTEEPRRGLRRHFLGLSCADDDEFRKIIGLLPAKEAVRDDDTVAAIKFGGLQNGAVAAGHDLLAGDRGVFTRITPGELMGLAVLVDVLSDRRHRVSKHVYDSREHSQRTTAARDDYNRKTTALELGQLLEDAGWAEGTNDGRAYKYERGDDAGELFEPTVTFTSAGKVYRPFDIFALDYENVDAAADDLISSGQVTVEAPQLKARQRPQVEVNQDVIALQKLVTSTLQRARSSVDSTLPLALSRQINGMHYAVVSVMPDGSAREWTITDADSLLVAAAQPVHKSDRGTSFRTGFDRNVVSGVLSSLAAPGVLRVVEAVVSEPVITKEGRIVRRPGYDPKAKVILVIPHRDRAAWATGYHVPEKPTLEEAQAAYDNLRTELQTDFLYKTATDRERHFAYLLTCVVRPTLLNGAPGFIANAYDPGTGKSLSLEMGRMLGQGHVRSADFTPTAKADDETEKRLTAMIEAGLRHLHADEVVRETPLAGTAITKATTAVDGGLGFRKLGVSELVPVAGHIISAAGNNAKLSGDHQRRWLKWDLDSTLVASVINRTGFRHDDILGWIKENRPQLVAWVHTIFLYAMQHEPEMKIPGMGFNHNWPKVVLGAMSHLTTPEGDNAAELALRGWEDSARSHNAISDEWGEFMAVLWRKLAGKTAPTAQIMTIVSGLPEAELSYLPYSLERWAAHAEGQRKQKWGETFASIANSAVVNGDVTYRIQAVEASERSNRSNRWLISAVDKNNQLIDPKTISEQGPTTPAPEWEALIAHLLAKHPDVDGYSPAALEETIKNSGLPLPPELTVSLSPSEFDRVAQGLVGRSFLTGVLDRTIDADLGPRYFVFEEGAEAA
ncbi:hypothetical protein GCM10022288_15770 [Gryllotalpicola kribbensis]|uniref:DUF927 domain-containing protein n=1 Tax=Gryllotalpicola kribbensis TaxID=993084 RepID=A0ABP8ARM2_9MICO